MKVIKIPAYFISHCLKKKKDNDINIVVPINISIKQLENISQKNVSWSTLSYILNKKQLKLLENVFSKNNFKKKENSVFFELQ